MNIKNYIHKLQQKPVRERERIAVVVTIVGFFIFVSIWVISLKEMNKPAETPVDQTSASLNDLKINFQEGKDSIQDMMQDLPATPAGGPSQALPAEEAEGATGTDDNAESVLPNPESNLQDTGDSLNSGNNNQNIPENPSVPQLP